MTYPTRLALFVSVAALLSAAAWQACSAGDAPQAPTAVTNQHPWTVPDINTLPDDTWGKTVRYGRDLINKTSTLIGPEVRDASKRFAGNNLDCQNCHVEGGAKEFGLPLVGVSAKFPSYFARTGRVGTLEDRIQGCMERSMNGKPLPIDGAEMTALVSYMKFLSTGRAIGSDTFGSDAGRIKELQRAADPVKGRTVYANTCAGCHGNDGQGQRNGAVGDAKGYLFPPLWGPDSFNDGAGMDKLINTANFVHSDMPEGTSWKNPVVSREDAWEVAAYVISQPRPAMANLDKDYPNRLEKPIDTPYGPYADTFSAEQHKYGPFGPIAAAIRALDANREQPHD
ncbi:c-type cytochrome [Hyphomicrobium sp.]|uniref:c-type cytochrome n=1 Tax=Hyphomicrobium sp. TaxID=82 RepID=UPI0025BEF5EB|nr:c-type cytochrome [Hyphomicrobium sp.]